MWFGVPRGAVVPSCLGVAAGASYGLPADWLAVQASLTLLLLPLARPAATAAQTACRLGWFAFAMACAAYLGFVLGIPAEVRPMAWVPLAALVLAHAASAAAVGAFAFRASSRPALRLAVALPALWLLQEWLLSQGELAIPWLRLGYLHASGSPLAGALPVGGVLLTGALSVALAGLAALGWSARRGPPGRRAWTVAALVVLMTWGAARIEWTTPTGTIRIAMAQGGAGSTEYARVDDAAIRQLLAFYLRSIETSRAELIVTSELAIPRAMSALPANYWVDLRDRLEQRRADALIGLHFGGPTPQSGYYNGALGLGVSGEQQYLKSRLFPFGEFMPFGPVVRAWIDSWRAVPSKDTARPATAGEPVRIAGR